MLKVFGGTASRDLAVSIAGRLGLAPGKLEVRHFPDGEIGVKVAENVRGHDVYIVQATSPPVADNLLELLLIIDAMRRAGATSIIAVIPYFGYARQDRRVTGMDPVSARVIASMLDVVGVSRIIVVDIHNPSIEGFFSLPLENISAVPVLAEAARDAEADIVVAPDLGAEKLAERYAGILGLPLAVVHKTRFTGTEVRVRALAGDVAGRRPLIVDDMVSTAGTIEAAAQALLDAGCRHEIAVAATHGLLVEQAKERLKALALKRLYLTNSIARETASDLPVQEVDLSPLLAKCIERLHLGESIVDLLVRL